MSARLPRSAWTTHAAAAPALLDPDEVAGLAVHWEGTPVPAAVAKAVDEAAVARHLEGIRRFHTEGRGWSDIAYQFAVDNQGRRWELRGWRLQSAANGDQLVNQRYGAVLALLGQGQAATPAMLDGLRDAVVDFRAHYPHARKIVGHQDVRPDPTSCPGPQLERLVHGGGLEPIPRPPQPNPGKEDDVTLEELTKALRDNKHPLTLQLRRNVREAVQLELAEQAAGQNS